MSDDERPIIIKKVKKVVGGHHGGAWKVAYADFVTAMMAFFLLMWLLNATEADQLAGLADYFAPTIGVQGEKGIGFRGGKAALSDGIGADINTNKGIVFGGVPSGPIIKLTKPHELPTQEVDGERVVIFEGGSGEIDESEELSFSYAQQQLEGEISAIDGPPGSYDAVNIVQTIEGLMIQIKDTKKHSMFEEATAILRPWAQEVLRKVAKVAKSLPNFITMTGHATEYYIGDDPNYTIWELSADRANAARRYLLENGVQEDRIYQVIGKGDNAPLVEERPDLPENNRIDIVLLRDAQLPYHKQVIPDGLFDRERDEVLSVTQTIVADDVPEQGAEQEQQEVQEDVQEEVQQEGEGH